MVELDHVEGGFVENGVQYLTAGQVNKFHLRLINNGTPNCRFNPAVAFKVSSYWADWGTTTIESVYFDELFGQTYVEYHSADGQDADTVGIAGMAIAPSAPGLYEGLDAVCLTISIRPTLSSIGDEICLDKVVDLNGYDWMWYGNGLDEYHLCSDEEIIPEWGGPYCFRVGDPAVAPTLSSIVPDHGSIRGGEQVDIYGSNFDPLGVDVHFWFMAGWDDVVSATVLSTTHVRAETPEGCELGEITVTAFNYSALDKESNELEYTYDVPDSVFYEGQVLVYDSTTRQNQPLPGFKFDIISKSGSTTTVLKQGLITDDNGYYADSAAGTADSVFYRFTSGQEPDMYDIWTYTDANTANHMMEAYYQTRVEGKDLYYYDIVFFDDVADGLSVKGETDSSLFVPIAMVLHDMSSTSSVIAPVTVDDDLRIDFNLSSSQGVVSNWHHIQGAPFIYLAGDGWANGTSCHELGHQLHYQFLGRDTLAMIPPTPYNPHYQSLVSDTIFAFSEGFGDFIRVISTVPEAFFDPRCGDTTMDYEDNEWWMGPAASGNSNTEGELVEGAVASMLLDLYDDDFTPTRLSGGTDDDDVCEPQNMLPRIFACMADTAYLSQKTISFNIFANKLLHNPNAYWYNDIGFDDLRGAICDIFKDHAFSVPGGWCLKNDIVEGPESPDGLPTHFALAQNYPNPFNGQTRIEFSVADPGDYEFTVYDILGRVVHTERFCGLRAGEYTVDVSEDTFGDIASGVYFYQVGGQTETITRKMLLIK